MIYLHPDTVALKAIDQPAEIHQSYTLPIQTQPDGTASPSISLVAVSVSHQDFSFAASSGPVHIDPTAGQDPAINQDPATSQDPAINQDPATSQDSAINQDPATSQDSAINQDPATSQDLIANPDSATSQDPGLTPSSAPTQHGAALLRAFLTPVQRDVEPADVAQHRATSDDDSDSDDGASSNDEPVDSEAPATEDADVEATPASAPTPASAQSPAHAPARERPASPPSLSARVFQAATEMRGFNTSRGPGGGRLACAWTVNQVLHHAGIAPIGSNPNYVPAVDASLQAGRGRLVTVDQAEPGDIIIARHDQHIGICLTARCSQVISNSSSHASFSWVTNSRFDGFYDRYGGVEKIFRLVR